MEERVMIQIEHVIGKEYTEDFTINNKEFTDYLNIHGPEGLVRIVCLLDKIKSSIANCYSDIQDLKQPQKG